MSPVLANPVWTSSARNRTLFSVQISRTSLSHPSGGTITPASPCIGSARKATVFGVMASRSACASPYGIVLNPGVYGPNPSLANGSVEKLMIVTVRPWKLCSQVMISCLPFSTPLTRLPHRRAVFKAVSTASAPVFIGRTMSLPVSFDRLS